MTRSLLAVGLCGRKRRQHRRNLEDPWKPVLSGIMVGTDLRQYFRIVGAFNWKLTEIIRKH